MDEYWELELELAKIADSMHITRKQLIDNFHNFDASIKVKIRSVIKNQYIILRKQYRHLTLVKGK